MEKSTTSSPVGTAASSSVKEDSPLPDPTNQTQSDPLVENPILRMTGYGARIGRLLGEAFSKGVRYTAYTSDVGEAFRPVVDRRLVQAGYAVSWTYVLADVALQTKWARERNRDYVRAGLHAAVFQTFGSMLFPAMIIHTTVHQSEKLFHKIGIKSRWAPVGLGLSVVPFLPYICDHPVEYATDLAFDTFWPNKDGEHHHHSSTSVDHSKDKKKD